MNEIPHYASPITEHFIDTHNLAKEKSEVNEAGIEARKHIIPMCNAIEEKGGDTMTLYNQDQMLVMFQLGVAWRESIYEAGYWSFNSIRERALKELKERSFMREELK